MFQSIKNIPDYSDPTKNVWEEDPNCSGYEISNKNCHLRIDEMILVTYQPHQCKTGEIKNCDQLVAYARFNRRNQVMNEALMQFYTTIFTCIIMTIGSLMFSADTDKIIILPITKMVGIIKTLADDPL